MFKDKTVAVTIPCYNEETQISKVIETMPDYVDKMIIVDDCSKDNTVKIIKEYAEENSKIVFIEHEKNQGVGGAIATGYKWARDNKIDITVVMAGDGQMDPREMPFLLEVVANNRCDYSKANRLISGKAYQIIPKVRYFGNSVLSLLTKFASGYWHISDSQTGYTAISLKALETIDLDKIFKRYGVPNDILVKLNVYNFKVIDIPQEPVYNVGEKSKMNVPKVTFSISKLLINLFLYRMKEKYIIRDFHPLVFFYFFGITLGLISIPLFARLIYFWIFIGSIPKIKFLTWMLTLIMSVQFILFAMWFDMESNKDLKG